MLVEPFEHGDRHADLKLVCQAASLYRHISGDFAMAIRDRFIGAAAAVALFVFPASVIAEAEDQSHIPSILVEYGENMHDVELFFGALQSAKPLDLSDIEYNILFISSYPNPNCGRVIIDGKFEEEFDQDSVNDASIMFRISDILHGKTEEKSRISSPTCEK